MEGHLQAIVLGTTQNKVFCHLVTQAPCPVCGKEDEGSHYALVACMHASDLWDAMGMVWPIPAKETVLDTGIDWLLLLLAGIVA